MGWGGRGLAASWVGALGGIRVYDEHGTVDDADLLKRPVEGFSAGLVDDSNVFEWSVQVMGPPDTL